MDFRTDEQGPSSIRSDDFDDHEHAFYPERRRSFYCQYAVAVLCFLFTLGGLVITALNTTSTSSLGSNVIHWKPSASLPALPPFSSPHGHDISTDVYNPSSSSSHAHDQSTHMYNPSDHAMTGLMKSPCGNTPAEAKARNCHFDIITFCWLPHRCYDEELSKSFEELVDWKWYLDRNKTQPVPKTDALQGELDGLYVSWEYHVQHCVYMWQKMHRALLGPGKKAIDTYISPYSHTEHCGKMLLTRGDGYALSDINTRIRVKFPDCGIE
ncbi:uncharacterized protein N7500_005434 [Penicillium coprophilum]|uniref:uncharacterized protein n=1 Tax=Penicillium coprophilum TaxID=36646 RepID=UPI00239F30EF|nr:uncharacterized protein N7500_005434 [Penicillium coprophilum]KAJ5163604.1 hypothetical protein N7500_005434 [Penicillium coprophilum]